MADELETAEPPVDEAALAEAARATAAARTGRGGARRTPEPLVPAQREVEMPTIADDAAFDALKPGKRFRDPQGQVRVKPWTVRNDRDFEEVPEGEQFIGPDGQLRQKQKYESVNFTANTLFHAVVNDKEAWNALNRVYPGRVRGAKGSPRNELYVEDEDGVLRKPKGFLDAPGSVIAGMAFPVAGATAGGITGGAAAGAAGLPTGPGAAVTATAGAIGGSYWGGVGGQAINDIVLGLAGVYERSNAEEAHNLAWAGTASATGEVVGRGVARAISAPKELLNTYLPAKLAGLLGINKQDMGMASSLMNKGVLVPAETYMHEAPHVQNMQLLDKGFRKQDVFKQSREDYVEKTAKELLEDMGMPVQGSIFTPEAATSTEAAAKVIQARILAETQEADAKMAAALAWRKEQAQLSLPIKQEAQEEIIKAAEKQVAAAKQLLDQGYQEIDKDIVAGLKVAKAGSNSGDMWWSVGEKLRGVKTGLQQRFNKMYSEADQVAGGAHVATGPLAARAQLVLDHMPEEFTKNYPQLVRDIAKLAESETGTVGWTELRGLRTALRSNIDWWKLNSNFRNGSMKFLEDAVDDALHSGATIPSPVFGAGQGFAQAAAGGDLKTASALLKGTDRAYSEEMAIFNSKELNAIMRGLEAGVPADETTLYNAIFKSGKTEQSTKILNMLGPDLRAGLRAADMKAIMSTSMDLEGNIEGKRFAAEILSRKRDNMLHAIHGDELGDKLLKQAIYVEKLEGRLPIKPQPGDTALDTISRARMAAEIAIKEAEKDPVKALSNEIKQIERTHAKEVKQAQAERKTGLLKFLYDESVGANAAVNKIISNPDTLVAAANKFGQNSSEFELLRQVYTRRMFESGGRRIDESLAKITPEVQQLLWGNVSLDMMQTLAREVRFLFDTRIASQAGTGSSIMVNTAVEHPAGRFLGKGGSLLPKIPGGDFAMRGVLTQYYKFMLELQNNRPFNAWISRAMNGDAAAKAQARQAIQNHMQKGGVIGAGMGGAEGENARQGADAITGAQFQ